jgi:adenine-specific DNA-methyltransferase
MPKDGLDEVYEFVESLKKKKVPIPEAETELKKFYSKKGYDRGITLYCNLDEEYRVWGKINVSWPNSKTGPRYDVIHPQTKKPTRVPENGWRYKEDSFKKMLGDTVIKRHDGSFVSGKIWFAADEKTQPSTIQYLDDVKDFLLRSIISLKSSGNEELAEYVPGGVFPHPKTYNLIKHLLQTIEGDDFIVLDSFAGSGTTGQAVMELNQNDKGKRKFILVELEESVAKSVTSKRLQKAIEQKSYHDGFAYCKLEKPLFNEKGQINEQCTYEELASYIYFTETHTNAIKKNINAPLVGESNGISYYLLYTGKNKNDLTRQALAKLKITGPAVIYADRCLVDEDELSSKGITFKQIPYEIKVY